MAQQGPTELAGKPFALQDGRALVVHVGNSLQGQDEKKLSSLSHFQALQWETLKSQWVPAWKADERHSKGTTIAFKSEIRSLAEVALQSDSSF